MKDDADNSGTMDPVEALRAIAALAPRCEEDDCADSDEASGKHRLATHVTTLFHTTVPLYLCEVHAPEHEAMLQKAESKGCGKQPPVEPYVEQNPVFRIAIDALAAIEAEGVERTDTAARMKTAVRDHLLAHGWTQENPDDNRFRDPRTGNAGGIFWALREQRMRDDGVDTAKTRKATKTWTPEGVRAVVDAAESGDAGSAVELCETIRYEPRRQENGDRITNASNRQKKPVRAALEIVAHAAWRAFSGTNTDPPDMEAWVRVAASLGVLRARAVAEHEGRRAEAYRSDTNEAHEILTLLGAPDLAALSEESPSERLVRRLRAWSEKGVRVRSGAHMDDIAWIRAEGTREGCANMAAEHGREDIAAAIRAEARPMPKDLEGLLAKARAEGAAAEREACAQVAENYDNEIGGADNPSLLIVNDIRARGKVKGYDTDHGSDEPSRPLVEALYRLRRTLSTAEQREAVRVVERYVYDPHAGAPRCGKSDPQGRACTLLKGHAHPDDHSGAPGPCLVVAPTGARRPCIHATQIHSGGRVFAWGLPVGHLCPESNAAMFAGEWETDDRNKGLSGR